MTTKFATWAAEATLKELAKQVGMGALNKLTDDLFDASKRREEETQKSIEDLKNKLQEVMGKLNGIDNKIDTLQNNMDDGFYDVKLDMLQTSVDRINGYYEMYMSAVKVMGSGKKEKAPGSYRARLRDLGLQLAALNGVYPDLKRIHSGLVEGEHSLVRQVIKKSARDSKDLITHYVRSRAVLANYFAVQAKGLVMMNFAYRDPDVPFQDGEDDMNKIWDNLNYQEDYFVNLFGTRTESFVRRLLKNRNEGSLTTFACEALPGKSFVFEEIIGVHKVSITSGIRLWKAELAQKDGTDQIDVNGDYSVYFTTLAARQSSNWNTARLNVFRGGLGFNWENHSWKLVHGTGDRVRIQLFGGDNKWIRGQPGAENLQLETGSDAADNTYYFDIAGAEDYGIGDLLTQQDEPLPAGVPLVSSNRRWCFELSRKTGYLQLSTMDKDEIVWVQKYGDAPPDPQGRLQMQSDGNLVVCTKDGTALWGTATNSSNGRSLWITTDGFIFVKGADGGTYWAPRGGS